MMGRGRAEFIARIGIYELDARVKGKRSTPGLVRVRKDFKG